MLAAATIWCLLMPGSMKGFKRVNAQFVGMRFEDVRRADRKGKHGLIHTV
jgi:hypothetical protein